MAEQEPSLRRTKGDKRSRWRNGWLVGNKDSGLKKRSRKSHRSKKKVLPNETTPLKMESLSTKCHGKRSGQSR